MANYGNTLKSRADLISQLELTGEDPVRWLIVLWSFYMRCIVSVEQNLARFKIQFLNWSPDDHPADFGLPLSYAQATVKNEQFSEVEKLSQIDECFLRFLKTLNQYLKNMDDGKLRVVIRSAGMLIGYDGKQYSIRKRNNYLDDEFSRAGLGGSSQRTLGGRMDLYLPDFLILPANYKRSLGEFELLEDHRWCKGQTEAELFYAAETGHLKIILKGMRPADEDFPAEMDQAATNDFVSLRQPSNSHYVDGVIARALQEARKLQATILVRNFRWAPITLIICCRY